MKSAIVKIIKKTSKYWKWIFGNTYIVRVDGGIASQMYQYAMGYSLEREKRCKVLYDLSWYKSKGVDIDGKYIRNFDLKKLFPDLPFKEAGKIRSYLYKNLFRYVVDKEQYMYFEVTELPKAPLLLDGYGYKVPNILLREVYDNAFSLDMPERILDAANLSVYYQIKQCHKSVAVHVRRGDMAQERYGYRPLSPAFFVKCMNFDAISDGMFFFFSDEIEWVQEQIVPLISEKKYQIVDINGSEKGYMDLYLCACCNHIISSQGTMGRTAAMLSKQQDNMLLFVPDFKYSSIFEELNFVKRVIVVQDELD